MRPIISLSVCVLILGTTAAVAGQDPVEPTNPTQAQPMSAPQPPSATAATSSSATTPASSPSATPPSAATTSQPTAAPVPVSKDAADRADTEKRLIAAGYKLHVGKDGQRTFCRRETPLGSHFETKVCGSAEQLADSTQNSKYLTDKILRIDNNPPGVGTNPRGY